MCWRQLSQRICAMVDPDLRARGIDPVLIRSFVMHEQIRLQGFYQTRDLRTLHFRMHRGAGESKRPARAGGENVRIPAMGFVRTPEVEHSLCAAHCEVPGKEMEQSWTTV